MKLADTCIVVTGAAGGIGAALARRFATETPRGIVVSDRDEAGIEAVAREIAALPVPCLPVRCDVCPRDIKMVITFHSDVRFRRIIYRDARN